MSRLRPLSAAAEALAAASSIERSFQEAFARHLQQNMDREARRVLAQSGMQVSVGFEVEAPEDAPTVITSTELHIDLSRTRDISTTAIVSIVPEPEVALPEPPNSGRKFDLTL